MPGSVMGISGNDEPINGEPINGGLISENEQQG